MILFLGIILAFLLRVQSNTHVTENREGVKLEGNGTEEFHHRYGTPETTVSSDSEITVIAGRRRRDSEADPTSSQPDAENGGRQKRQSISEESSLSVAQPNPDLPEQHQEGGRKKRSLVGKRSADEASLSVAHPNPDLPDVNDITVNSVRRRRAVSENTDSITSRPNPMDDSNANVTTTKQVRLDESALDQEQNSSNESTGTDTNLDLEIAEILKNSTEPTDEKTIKLIKELEAEESAISASLDNSPQEVSEHGVITEHEFVAQNTDDGEDESEVSDNEGNAELFEAVTEDEVERTEEYNNITKNEANSEPIDNVDENKLLMEELKQDEKDTKKLIQDEKLAGSSKRRKRRSVRKKRFLELPHDYRWTKGIVPYRFDKTITEKAEVEIKATMRLYEKYTCIRFVPHEGETTRDKYQLDHDGFLIFVEKHNGCWATQGNHRKATGQEISCCHRHVCIHEIGHALGLYHEHQSPLSHGWKIVNWNNIQSTALRWYREIPEYKTLAFGYDFTNPMHYGRTEFGNGNGPTQSILFKELESITHSFHNPFYLLSEISRSHTCAEDHCPDFKEECVHGGYLSQVNGECRCNCPPGFDPNTNCADILRSSSTTSRWPKGSYATFKPSGGCSDGFKEGSVTHHSATKNLVGSPFNLSGDYSQSTFTHEFCVMSENKDGEDWEPGQYCILRAGGACPKGFEEGFIQFDDATEVNGQIVEIETSGKLPDGIFTEDVGIQVCCRNDGYVNEPISLPLDKPFVLIPYDYRHPCQHVNGAEGYNEFFRFANDASDVAKLTGETNFVFDMFNKFKLHFCYYVPYKKDCGQVITVSADEPEVTLSSPGNPDGYDDNQECTWLIEGPTNSNILLNFEEFDFEVVDEKCKDGVEIRYNQIGQTGFRYCGEQIEKSIRSINNFIVLLMKTDMSGRRKGFKAKAKLITPDDLCYEASDRGKSYRGTVNYDREFTQCVPWSQTTNCPYHQFSDTGSGASLEENYCRNPDDTFRPWCYIRNGEGECMRNYCDVCGFESLYDKDADCEKLKGDGFCLKPREEVISKCAKTCELEVLKADIVSTISCPTPNIPEDSDALSDLAAIYSVGDTVNFKCKTGSDSHNVSCLTDGTWSPAQFVCGGCSPGWTRHNGECYQYFKDVSSFTDAEQTCQQFGEGMMAASKTQDELDFLSSLRPKTAKIWIGLTDREEEGTFKWLDGSSVVWDNWSEGSPSGQYGHEDCVVMYGEQVNSKWNDHPCSSQHYQYPFICQYTPSGREMCINRRSDCRELLEETPTMCQEYPDFSIENCAVDCGICKSESIEAKFCVVDEPNDNVDLETTKMSLQTGELVTYKCKEGYDTSTGNLNRVCLLDGSLTGSSPDCKSADTGIGPNSNVQLIRFSRVGGMCKMYTANNDNFRITREGEIIQWDFYSLYPGDAAFIVFRPTADPFGFKMIGINRVSNTINDGVQNLQIPTGERIQVQPGDQIGLWYGYKRAGIPFDFCDEKDRPEAANTLQISGFLCNAGSLKVDEVFQFDQNRAICRVYSFRAIIGPSS